MANQTRYQVALGLLGNLIELQSIFNGTKLRLNHFSYA